MKNDQNIDNRQWNTDIKGVNIWSISLFWVSSKHKSIAGKHDKSSERLCNHNYRLLHRDERRHNFYWQTFKNKFWCLQVVYICSSSVVCIRSWSIMNSTLYMLNTNICQYMDAFCTLFEKVFYFKGKAVKYIVSSIE